MNTATALLDELRRRGIQLRAAGDRLRFKPASAVPTDLLAAMAEHKPALLALLTPGEQAAAGPPAPSQASAHTPAGLLLTFAEAPAFGQVCKGWRPADWAARLRQLAERCERLRPDLASMYRASAEQIEAALRGAGAEFHGGPLA